MSLPSLRRPCAVLVLASALAIDACRDAPPEPGGDAPVHVLAALAGTSIEFLTVEVTGPAIRSPLVANVAVPDGATSASATIMVPVGGQRTFVARGFDSDGLLTHEGMATSVVRPSGNPTLTIRIYPRTGDVPITVGVGDYAIGITPATLAATPVAETRQLTATVTGEDAAPVPGAVVTWGSLNPAVAGVDSDGLVTARRPGTTTIVASYRGLAASSVDLTVTGPPVVYRSIAAGNRFTCALDEVGAAWCWGLNGQGQLGDGGSGVRSRPAPVSGSLRFTELAAANGHVCGLTAVGEAWCWGANTWGQVGSGSTTLGAVRAPSRVTGNLSFSGIAAGHFTSCGIRAEGDVWCWGAGAVTVGTTPRSAPALDLAAGAAPWTSLGLAGSTACAVDAAGGAFCSTTNSSTPHASAQGTTWRTLQVGDLNHDPTLGWVGGLRFACGLTAAGEIRCQGGALHGELGRGSGPLGNGQLSDPAFAPVSGPQGYSALALGGRFVCGLRDAAAFCWGRNTLGQLGDGSRVDRHVPTAVSGGHAFTRISASLSHACGVRADGVALCWGDNEFGQLGTGSMQASTRPAAVVAPAPSTP